MEVEVSGASFLHADANGLIFGNRPGAWVRYGHGTFIDAQGTRTEVPARYVGGTIRLEVPADVLAHAAFPAVLDPIIGPEIDLFPTAVRPMRATSVDVVFAAGHYVAAYTSQFNEFEVHMRRFQTDGTPLDLGGTTVARLDRSLENVSLAFNGTNFLIAYAKNDLAPGKGIYGVIVAEDGTVVVPEFVIASPPGEQNDPSAASDGTDFFVAYADVGISKTYGARVTAAGAVLDPDGFEVFDRLSSTPSVAFGGGQYMVAGSRLVRTISTSGTRGATVPTGFQVTGAFGDGQFMATGDSQAIRVSPASDVLGTTVLDPVAHPATVAHDGTHFRVTNRAGEEVRIFSVAADGTIIGSTSPLPTGGRTILSIASDGADVFATWLQAIDDVEFYAFGARVDDAIIDDPPLSISQTFAAEESPTSSSTARATSSSRETRETPVCSGTSSAAPASR